MFSERISAAVAHVRQRLAFVAPRGRVGTDIGGGSWAQKIGGGSCSLKIGGGSCSQESEAEAVAKSWYAASIPTFGYNFRL